MPCLPLFVEASRVLPPTPLSYKYTEIMLFRFNFTMLLELHSMYNDILFFFHWINKQVCSTNIFTKPQLTLWSRKTHAEHNQWTYLSAMISDEKRNGRKDECVERCLRLAYFLLCMLFHFLFLQSPPHRALTCFSLLEK